MLTLFDLPDELFSNCVLKFLTATDLWRLSLVCRKFHGNDPESHVVQREFQARDDALIRSKQYFPKSPMMSIWDCRQRVASFERCSCFASEMRRHAQVRETRGYSCNDPCNDPDCTYPDLHAAIPALENGLRDGKHYFFFAQFTCSNELVWQGFLGDYDPQTDMIHPADDLPRTSGDEGRNEIMDLVVDIGRQWIRKNQPSDVLFHLDTRNVTHFTKESCPCWSPCGTCESCEFFRTTGSAITAAVFDMGVPDAIG